jgi:hypothetical protein
MSASRIPLDVQKALFGLFTKDTVLTSLIDKRVYDYVPQELGTLVFPFVHIGEHTWGDGGCKTAEGYDGEITIHAWSRQRSNEEVMKIQAAVCSMIHGQQLKLPSGVCYVCRLSFQTVMRDPDGQTLHGVLKFHIQTMET